MCYFSDEDRSWSGTDVPRVLSGTKISAVSGFLTAIANELATRNAKCPRAVWSFSLSLPSSCLRLGFFAVRAGSESAGARSVTAQFAFQIR